MRFLVQLLRQAGRRGLPRRATRRWRRSLQLRVVVSTLVVSGGVVLVLGMLLMSQVTKGILSAKTRSALEEANSGLVVAQSQLAEVDPGDPVDADDQLYRVTLGLANRGSAARLFDVAVLSSSPAVTPVLSGTVRASSIPAELRASVERGKRQAYMYAPLLHRDGSTEPGLIVGAQLSEVDAGPYQLYYLFTLEQEASTIRLIQRIMTFAGVVLVLLLVFIAGLVTREVVLPVRVAARTAERFAAGELHRRMEVRGEDELARLATTFNRMAASLQGQISQLEELSRLQRRFVADVSHELRTPLTTVRMAADMLHESRDDFAPEVARSAELLQTQLDRFEVLLADLLEISRYDAGAAVLEPEPTDLCALVRSAAEAVEPLARRHNSALVLRLPDRAVVAEVDPRRIDRILRNLLDNAVEHSEGKPVEVSLAADSDAVAIAVRDFGVGLRPAEAAQVFNRFWRADPARARVTGGTGLGLSIALEDTRLHGGWLDVSGRLGRGSVFRLTLPVLSGGTFRFSPIPIEGMDTRTSAGEALPSVQRELPAIAGPTSSVTSDAGSAAR